jgi:hypothetical protein
MTGDRMMVFAGSRKLGAALQATVSCSLKGFFISSEYRQRDFVWRGAGVVSLYRCLPVKGNTPPSFLLLPKTNVNIYLRIRRHVMEGEVSGWWEICGTAQRTVLLGEVMLQRENQ